MGNDSKRPNRSQQNAREPLPEDKDCADTAAVPAALPCPFCAGRGKMMSVAWPYPRWWVRCTGCRLSMNRRDSEEKAVAIWTTRASIDDEAWRDIATAPKDGQRVDLWATYSNSSGASRGERYPSSKWYAGRWTDCYGNQLEWDHPADEEGVTERRQVTHWRPLPAPPGQAIVSKPPLLNEAVVREMLDDFADALSWNSSIVQCLDRVRDLVEQHRAAIAAFSTDTKGQS